MTGTCGMTTSDARRSMLGCRCGSTGTYRIPHVVTQTRSPSSALLSPLLGEGSPTKIDYSKKATLILTSLLEDLEKGIPQ